MQDYEKVGGLLVPVNEIGKPRGIYTGTLIKGGYFDDDGVWHRGREVVDHFVDTNLAVAQGLTSMLGVYFHADSQLTSWYFGLFEGNYNPVDGITASGIASASTETTAYSNSTRPAYLPSAASSKSISNAASRASFVFTAQKTIYGAILISDNTKGGTAGTLFSCARFLNAKTVDINDELLLTYTFTLTSA